MMTDFSYGGVCAPTAATNLCEYWTARNPTKYSKLKNPNGWLHTSNSFYSLMGTNKDTYGTYDSNIASAYSAYFKQVGLSCTSSFTSGTNNGEYVIGEINNDRPCHLILHSNYMYEDHSVLALGYQNYEYTVAAPFIYRESNIKLKVGIFYEIY